MPDPHFWQGRRVLVTGPNGFIAAWLIETLLDAGAEVVGFDRSPAGTLDLHPGLRDRIELVIGDLTDQPKLEKALADHGIQTLYHLAAQSSISISSQSPIPAFESNIRGTWCVLDACRSLRQARDDRRRLQPDGVRRPGLQPLRRVVPAERQRPVRGLQGVHGHHRALLRRHLRHARRGGPDGQHLRAGRSPPGPHHPRHAALAAPRRAPGDPQRRLAHARGTCTSRTSSRRTCCSASGRPGWTCVVGRSTSTRTSRSRCWIWSG